MRCLCFLGIANARERTYLSAMRFLKNLALMFILLSAPITLGGIGWGYYLISQTAPLAVFMIICASTLIVALGFANLLDTRNPLPTRPQDHR